MESIDRSVIIKKLSEVYVKFLLTIDWKDELFLKGINEGRNKFLSNAYLNLCHGKHSITNYYSLNAKDIISGISKGNPKGRLVFEHMVPKEKYIQRPCESIIRDNSLSLDQKADRIHQLLDKYWYIASITADEDRSIIHKRTMPTGWNGDSIFDRYEEVNIEVHKNERWV